MKSKYNSVEIRWKLKSLLRKKIHIIKQKRTLYRVESFFKNYDVDDFKKTVFFHLCKACIPYVKFKSTSGKTIYLVNSNELLSQFS